MVWIPQESFVFLKREIGLCAYCDEKAQIEEYLGYKYVIVFGFTFLRRVWLHRFCPTCETKSEHSADCLPEGYERNIPFFVRYSWAIWVGMLALAVVSGLLSLLG